MYALEIDFKGDVSVPEHLLLRRPSVTVGSEEYHHVMLGELAEAGYSLHISRRLERGFHVSAHQIDEEGAIPENVVGDYDGEALLDLGPVALHITALDLDLAHREDEPYDRGGVRILREAVSTRVVSFPAIYVPAEEEHEQDTLISFRNGQSVLLGRSHACHIRFDIADISSKHARIGYEGGEFWVEDLGSTNGTFVDGKQITARETVKAGESVVLGKEIIVFGVSSPHDIERSLEAQQGEARELLLRTESYPAMYSLSEVTRPARYVLRVGYEVSIGRDPSSDIWLGVPHVSRKHCTVMLEDNGEVCITDYSKNGVSCDGELIGRGQHRIVSQGKPCVLSFGGSVTIALCFDEKDEKSFLISDGDTFTFTALDVKQNSRARSGFKGPHDDLPQTRSFKRFYRSLTFQRKLFLLMSVFLVLVVLLFFVKLLIPVFR